MRNNFLLNKYSQKLMFIKFSYLRTFVILFFFCIFLLRVDYSIWKKYESPENEIEKKFPANLDDISSRNNIFFLKTHKCASSSIQNILMRYGLTNGLDFVLPPTTNYIGNPLFFSPSMIWENCTTVNNKYNIFTHHTRFDYSAIRSIMYDDAVYVTILRNPATQFESLFDYYTFEKVFKLEFQDLLTDPKNVRKINRRFFKRIGLNQMSWDLGLEEKYFNDKNSIKKFISKIDEKLNLIMIAEHFEASLVLLANLLKWPIKNFVSLKLNSRQDEKRRQLTLTEKKVLYSINKADTLLYQHFLKKFQKHVKMYGKERMIKDIGILMNYNNAFKNECVISESDKGYKQSISYEIASNANWQCIHATLHEYKFTREIRNAQIQRTMKQKNLYNFMNNSHELT